MNRFCSLAFPRENHLFGGERPLSIPAVGEQSAILCYAVIKARVPDGAFFTDKEHTVRAGGNLDVYFARLLLGQLELETATFIPALPSARGEADEMQNPIN